MNLSELKEAVDSAIEKAAEYNESPDEIIVSVQIDALTSLGDFVSSLSAVDNVELCYDGNGTASGCVLLGVTT